jgi:catechol 2,3-dioxygenase
MTSAHTTTAVRPAGVSHLVLNVRDIEVSHRFWTEVMGFEQCGELDPSRGMTMRFYRGDPTHHHDLALAQVTGDAEAAPGTWSMRAARPGLNHVAISYPGRDAWLKQLAHLQQSGVSFNVRGEHGMSHSAYIADPDGHGIEVLYDLPAEVWDGDLNAALNYFKLLPTEGETALEDSTDYPKFGAEVTATP